VSYVAGSEVGEKNVQLHYDAEWCLVCCVTCCNYVTSECGIWTHDP